ncbi:MULTISPECIES: hypothetical protein [Bacillus]|uniref:hypothetical protein n=1 Tax=Bacillus TaxID=1386 RepID=UPI0015A70930|nr:MULTISPECIES: hypothetical protein [Bacillus]MBL4978826.1 hypothetical protein [Bacillus halotolerans]UJE04059.1 hypothetical protein HNV25_10770 [Bacillus subtilis]WDI23541.1 hypothetical protein PUW21_11005 [Bacillus subtilis]
MQNKGYAEDYIKPDGYYMFCSAGKVITQPYVIYFDPERREYIYQGLGNWTDTGFRCY